jgi:Molybdopterin cofactor-binding domain
MTDPDPAARDGARKTSPPAKVSVTLHVNGVERKLNVAPWTAYDKTQGCQNSWHYVAGVCELPPDKVRVLSPYVGGGFGSGLRPQVSATPRGACGARAQAIGAGDAHAPADVHPRIPGRHRPGAGARGRARWQARLVSSPHRRDDVAVRRFPASFRQLVAPALSLRERRRRARACEARPKHALRHARAWRS